MLLNLSRAALKLDTVCLGVQYYEENRALFRDDHHKSAVEGCAKGQKALAESAAREARLAAEQAAQVTPVIDPPAEMTSEEEVPVAEETTTEVSSDVAEEQ